MMRNRLLFVAAVAVVLFAFLFLISSAFASPVAQTSPCLMDFYLSPNGRAMLRPNDIGSYYFPGNQWVSVPIPDHYWLALDWTIQGLNFSDGDSITIQVWATFDGGSTFNWYDLLQMHPTDDIPALVSLPEGVGYRGLRFVVYSPDMSCLPGAECAGNYSVLIERVYVYQSTGCSTPTPTSTSTLVPWPTATVTTPTWTPVMVEHCPTKEYQFSGGIPSSFSQGDLPTDCIDLSSFDRKTCVSVSSYCYSGDCVEYPHTAAGNDSQYCNLILPVATLRHDLGLSAGTEVEIDGLKSRGWYRNTALELSAEKASDCQGFYVDSMDSTWHSITNTHTMTGSLTNYHMSLLLTLNSDHAVRGDDLWLEYCYEVTATPSATPSATPTPTASPTATPGNDVTATAQSTRATATAASWTSTPTETSTATATATSTSTPGNDSTATAQATSATATAAVWTATPSAPGGGGGTEGPGVTGTLESTGSLDPTGDVCIAQDLSDYEFICSAEDVPAFTINGWYRWLSGHMWYLFCNFSDRMAPMDEITSLARVPVLGGGYALCQVTRVTSALGDTQDNLVDAVTSYYSVTQQIMITQSSAYTGCSTLTTYLATDSVPDIGCEVPSVYCAIELFITNSTYFYPVWETLIMFVSVMFIVSGVKTVIYGTIVTPWSFTKYGRGEE